ncbi:probable E3 ubiquitin-protein ligase makorin-1 isoform X2 [Sitophilus oryzae]|nr:probable E3 ubiquitin-protein ligase makorin-1 isoform X2 [Sitophilus oryzae]
MKNQRPCYFYQMGRCKYQDRCRFLHDNDNKSANEPSTSQCNHIEDVNFAQVPNSENKAASDMELSSVETDIHSVEEEEPSCSSNSSQDTKTSYEQDSEEGACASPPLVIINNRNWVDAPEFIPRSKPQKSYAQVLHSEINMDSNIIRKMCPYASRDGICLNLGQCNNLHGELCDMCERFVLHPYDEEERKKHRQECLKNHEKNMELSFAIQRSKDKTCGVCFEVIMEKANSEQRFGILPNCNHCFCLACIRKWRQAHQFENKIIRACPECRVTSDFVCPSMYWVDTKEEKEKLIDDYKKALSNKACKYFKKGLGKCPFGNKCFYMHADKDGRIIDVGPPQRQRRNRYADTDIDVLQVMLWDFLDERDFPWQTLADDLEDLVSFFTESDESDWSDYELFFD